jgi:phosphoglycolate phosphatase-like HAD superfamily hydrolase
MCGAFTQGTDLILASSTTPAETSITTKVPEPRVFIGEGFLWDEQPAYLFDIDGTLLRDPGRVHYNAFFSGVKSVMGRELVLEGVTVAGNTDPGILHDAFRVAGLDDAEWRPHLEDILAAIRDEVLAQRETMQIRVMPGVEATLAHLKAKGAAVGVATGNIEAIGWHKIEIAELRDWFSFGGFSDRFAVRADMIAHAARIARAIVGPDASVCVVGDTPFDVSAARANQLPVIAVATGRYSFDELMDCYPDVCATTLEALLQQTAPAA